MTSGSLASSGVDIRECSSNLFTLADVNGLKWCKYTGNPCSLDKPLDDPVLVSFTNALQNNILCSWRHSPQYAEQRLNENLSCPESSKELWLFWYGDDPRTVNVVDSSLKEADHGCWETNFPEEAKVLLFKALHNTLERHLLSCDYIRVGKWFVDLAEKSSEMENKKLFFSFAFSVQGGGKICLTVDVKSLPGVRHIVQDDLAKAATGKEDFNVILGPYGIKAKLTGHCYQRDAKGVSRLLEDWNRFFPLHVLDEWSDISEKTNIDIPVVVGVIVEDNFIKYPSHYILISVEDNNTEGNSSETKQFTTPPASPFTMKDTNTMNQVHASTVSTETSVNLECSSKLGGSKKMACELVNESWRDITATKSTSKSSSGAMSQNKTFATNFKTDQESFWKLKEPLARKFCSCTSSSNVSRSRTNPPNRPFGINRPSPSPSQNSTTALAHKIKKERERKAIQPFHLRAKKLRNINSASKCFSTSDVSTTVADQNRQPNSHDSTAKSTDSTDESRTSPKLEPFSNENVSNNNNNNDDVFFKPMPPAPTRISDSQQSLDYWKKLSRVKDSTYTKSLISNYENKWKCYDVFTGGQTIRPTLPDDVLDFREGEEQPLTMENVVSMPENSGDVHKIETVENKNYHRKRTLPDERTTEEAAPAKRMRKSSSSGQSTRNKSETSASIKARGRRQSSTSTKPPLLTPSPEPGNNAMDTNDSVFYPVPTCPRGRANSASSCSATSPATSGTSSKAHRNSKQRKHSKKTTDNKPKEVVEKQEAPLPFLASPPTPRGSVSLRTEKDLQVTISDLDNLFDSPDDDEEDNKPRPLSVLNDERSPSFQNAHDDTNQKTKAVVNTGPCVVSHADLVRMFPTPPMVENHPNSPQPPLSTGPEPAEVSGQSGLNSIDASKSLNDEIHDLLNEIKEMPTIFEIPLEQEYLCGSSALLSTRKSSNSLLLKNEMVYTPSLQMKARDSISDLSSVTAKVSCASVSTGQHFDLNSVTMATNMQQTSKANSPGDTTSVKFLPEVDQNSNLLNANLFLSDSYVNYTSDRNLDDTNACSCTSSECKLNNRLYVDNDICVCGLRLFEKERLRSHTGLFSSESCGLNSCIDDIGVNLDIRYCDMAKRKEVPVLVKKEESAKVSKSVQSAELLGTCNSTCLVENLLDQFSSPLCASDTADKLYFTPSDNVDTTKVLPMKTATELEKQSKISVEFLMNLKPIIQESLHKAIHWKTWDQLCTVQGPLSLKQLWQMNNNGVLTTCDPARIPRVVVGQDGNWLSVSPLALHHWEKLFLEPYTSPRNVTYVVVSPENEMTNINVKYFFRELSSVYETCQLGRHVPLSKISMMASDGILRIGPKQQNKYGKKVVSSWFSKFENVAEGLRVKLFAQVFKYELGPLLEKLPLDKLNSTDFVQENGRTCKDSATVVVYIINPFEECSDQITRNESHFALLRSFTEMASDLPEKIRCRLVLEIIPLRQVTQVDAYQKTKGSLVSFVKLLKTTAFSVFSRCRVVVKKPVVTRVHTGFWATSSQRQALKKLLPEKTRERVYSPAYILATPTKLIHNVDTVDSPEDLTRHKESCSLLFCCYSLSQDQKWLLATCTNETGYVMETFITIIEPFGFQAKRHRHRQRIKALRRLWEFLQGITSSMVEDWRLVVGKLGRFTRNELRDWNEVIPHHSLNEDTEKCKACTSSRFHSRFHSVSIISLHNDLNLRIHFAKITTAFINYRDPDMTIVEPVTRQRISASFVVVSSEMTPSSRHSQLDVMRSVDDRSELLMSESNPEDDDEMPMMPLFGGIFPQPRISSLQQELEGSSPHERPSSAPMLTDTVSSSFVPIGMNSPHPSQSVCSDDHTEQDKGFGRPLAHGRIFTTAPFGPAFREFAHGEHVDGSTPIVLKASLLLHRIDETGRKSSHVLSSNTHSSILRYILEQYDALSWLTVDSMSEDRSSCLPAHYVSLSQMTRAFNGLLT